MFVGVGTGAYVAGRLPPGDARLLQGAPLPRLGQRDPRDAPRLSRHPLARRRAGHAEHGRAPAATCRGPSALMTDRDARDRRHSAVLRASSPRTRSSPSAFARGARARRSTTCSTAMGVAGRPAHRLLHGPADGDDLPGREPHRGEGARAPARGALDHDRAAGRARGAHASSAACSTCRPSSAGTTALERWLEPVTAPAAAFMPGGAAARHRPSCSWSAPRCAIGVVGLVAGLPGDAGAADRRPRTRRRRTAGFGPGAQPQVLRGRDLRRGRGAAARVALARGAVEGRGPGRHRRRGGQRHRPGSRAGSAGWAAGSRPGRWASTSCSSSWARCGSSAPWSGDRR